MSKRQVTITLNQLIGSNAALDKLLSAKLPAVLSFRLSMLVGEMESPFKRFNEVRASLMREHGKSADGGQTYNFEGEGKRLFEEGMAELLKEEVTIGVPRFQVSDLGEREILTPGEFYALRWLFVEEQEEFTPQPNGGAEVLEGRTS